MTRVFVAMSGGVDSSVTAALLKDQGHDVTGVFMKNWTQDLPGMVCPWKQDLNDARAVAAQLDIPLKVYDFESAYREKVVSYLLDEYRAGRTPNPDIMCNQEIKFKLFAQTALAEGAEMIATGHYAAADNGQLQRGVDESKDQTYFLYRIDPQILNKVLLPIGAYTKPQVRDLARKFNLPTASKPDSQGICFVGPVGMKAFLNQYVQAEPGDIVDGQGKVLGQHEGAIFYTVGQRTGLGLGGPDGPYFVRSKHMRLNQVEVTNDPDTLKAGGDQIELEDWHWLGPEPKAGQKLLARLRHRGELVPAELDGSRLVLECPVRAVAAGQSVVLYDGRRVLGGAVVAAVKPAPVQLSQTA